MQRSKRSEDFKHSEEEEKDYIRFEINAEEKLEIYYHSNYENLPQPIPQLLQSHINEEKNTLLLRDLLDCSSFIDAVNRDTGKLKFKLPLIDLTIPPANLKLDFFYDGNSQLSGILGLGWYLPQNFIMMDDQSSIFPEDTNYYIIIQDIPQQLTINSSNLDETVYSFKLSSDQPDLEILYYKNEERWEIDNKGVKQIYGRTQNSNTDPIYWKLTWENWRGVGSSSSTGQKQLATAWYLTEVRDKIGYVMRYKYNTVNISVPGGKSFTRESYLKTISDNQGNIITFNYSAKDVSEYHLLPLVDQEGNLNTQAVETRFLKGYNVATPSYKQNIFFIYKVKGGKRYLTEIKQQGDITNQSVLQFIYKDISKSHVLEKVILPSDLYVEFDYKLKKMDNIEKNGQRYDIRENYRVDYGADDILVSYLNNEGEVVLRLFDYDTIEKRLVRSDLPWFPSLGHNLTKPHEVFRAHNFFAVILNYNTNRELLLFHKMEGKWFRTPKSYLLSENALIRFGNDFIVLANDNLSIEVITTNNNIIKKFFIDLTSTKNPLLLTAFDRIFLVYNDERLWIGYRNRNSEWKFKVIKEIPRLISDIKDTLDKFDLEINFYNQLLSNLLNNAFQLNNNLLLFNRWKLEGTQIYSILDLFTLNSSYEIVQEKQYKVIQDDLSKFSHEIKLTNPETFFTLAYEVVNDSFKIYVKDFRGFIFNEIYKLIDEKEINRAKNETFQKVLNEIGKTFLLNPQKYLAVLNAPTVVCSNQKFVFIGDKWKMTTISEKRSEQEKLSIPLSDKYVLNKENLQSSFKLYKQGDNGVMQGSSLLDLEINQLNQTLVAYKYPVYFAYQELNKQIGVVEFSNDAGIDKIYNLPKEEKLSRWSSYQTLVTDIHTNFTNIVVFRSQLQGIRRLLPNPVITRVTVCFDNGNQRSTGYEYYSEKVFGSTVYYEYFDLIPGNDRRSFGWIEEYKEFGNKYKFKKTIFNAKGKVIKTLYLMEQQKKNTDSTDKKNLYLNTTIFDQTGKLEIANFFPYEITDEEIGYYGFENYEVNRVDTRNSKSKKKWFFNETNVIKQEFSFTGQNYLRLSEQSLEGIFQPKNQNQEYVASCWVRPSSKMLELGAITPYLKAIVFDENGHSVYGFLSDVKFQSGDWFYLEVVIDFLYAKQINNSLAVTKQQNGNLKMSIMIGSGVNTTIDIDHVRFSPLNSNFQANVYDPKTNRIKEVIHASGLVKKHIYDMYHDQVASVNQYGQIEEFNTYTKASSIGRVMQPKSIIQIIPVNGFFENFAPYSFYERWKINNPNSWQISPHQLHHLTMDSQSLQLRTYDISSVSYGMRLYFSLQSESSDIQFNSDLKLIRTNDRADIIFSGKRQSVPLDGEILIVVDHNRLFVWIDGGLYIDNSSNISLFNIEISGKVKISDLMVFSEPSIKVTYLNALGEKLQEVSLESKNNAIVTEYLYDELGRQAITTQSVNIERSNSQSILTYYSNFVTNGRPYSVSSVWKTGRLQGDASRTLGEYGYRQTKYANNPLHEKCAEGQPGKEFSVSGRYAKRFASSSDNLFINNLFPHNKNYSYQVEFKPQLVEDISVFDDRGNRVAWYVHVPDSKDLLSTYEYDDKNRLVKSLPPLYYEQVQNFYNSNSKPHKITVKEKVLQKYYGTFVSYDKKGNIITKTTPETGTIENLFDKDGLLKFVVHNFKFYNMKTKNIIYFDYDHLGRLSSTGKLTSSYTKEELLDLVLDDNNTQEYQQFYHSNYERDPILRGKLKRTITFNDGEPFIEESIINIVKETLSKRIIIPMKDKLPPLLVEINKRYVGGKLSEIDYPINVQGQPFKLTYQYNKLGRIIGIGVPGKQNLFFSFTYNAAGQVSSEHHLPESPNNFTRKYSYNTPGFLTGLKDKFLTQKIYYTDGAYGGHGYGDGTVTRTEFIATWHEYCDNRKLGLNEQSFKSKSITTEESSLCFLKLKENGYINNNNRQEKVYYPALEPKLPIICSYGITSRQIQKTLGKEGFPSQYGHSYDYGYHEQLTKAKYFVVKETALPLKSDTFAKEILGINSTASFDIWHILIKHRYLVDVDLSSYSSSHVKRGKSFISSTLSNDLRNINNDYLILYPQVARLLVNSFSQKQNISILKSNLKEALQVAAIEVEKMLEEKQYLKNPLTEEFNNILKKYEPFIPDIVHVLLEYFARELGESEFDFESYDIDANGNHKRYSIGFDGYDFIYDTNTNTVHNIKFRSYNSSEPEKTYSFKHHDDNGNVIQALHKGIQHIDYDVVSNRPTKIQLTDGKTLTFYYDAQGERVLKRVINSQGKTTKEIHYIRDEFRRSLTERELSYISQDLPPIVLVTAYIYGPRGLLGFIRRDEFYSVITDHEGSIRLVVKGDEVVAAYDYLPYGNLMRKFGSDPESHISYRYNGQEWDKELGLYNYHARFYDPSIGRFYQIDPNEQYFSPYKYAGNSPIAMIDPDGEFAFLLAFIIAGAIAGTYLGGSSSNQNWNPVEWDYKSGKTYIGAVLGGIGGALTPVFSVASVSFFTAAGLSTAAAIATTAASGVGVAYLSVAANNINWDPSKWDFSSPETFNAAFVGFGIGSGFAGAANGAGLFYKGLSTYGRVAFGSASTSFGVGTFVMNGFAAKWDFSKPEVYMAFLDALTSAPLLPMFLNGAGRSLIKNTRSTLEIYRATFRPKVNILSLEQSFRQRVIFIRSAFKSATKIVGGVAAVGSSAFLMEWGENDGEWDMTSFSTYYAMINGILTGEQLSSSGRSVYRRYKIKKWRKSNTITKNIGREVIEYYTKLETDNPKKSKTKLIPHSAMSVLITADEMALVAFSGNSGPGIIYFKDLKQNKPIIKVTLPDNSHIANEKVTLSDDTKMNDSIKRAIENKRKNTEQMNINEFLNEKNELIDFFKSKFSHDRVERFITDLSTNFNKKGFISNKELKQILETPLTELSNRFKQLNQLEKTFTNLQPGRENQFKAFENKIIQLENAFKFEPVKKLNSEQEILTENERIGKLSERLDSLKQYRDRVLIDNDNLKNAIADNIVVLWDDFFKKYSNKFTHWDPTNCAEPHVISALSRTGKIFDPDLRISYNYDFKDILFLSTYKLTYKDKITHMTPFPRCDHCVETTRFVENVITEPNWYENLKSKVNSKLDQAKLKFYFLSPILNTINGQTNVTDNENVAVVSRKRRSKIDEQTRIKVLPNYRNKTAIDTKDTLDSNHVINTSIANSALRSSSLNISQFNTQIDLHGTIFLIDVLIRKVTGETYLSIIDQPVSLLEARGFALEITAEFEKLV